ncbi:serine protease [Luteolibacter pohnpeiensis]|uniref:Serine protease n=1 Tax=Luteolibacter pohnpeiensis TaxID=454153 RepID=A0A934S9B7_9BACT|nr:S1C family serine protease [Luteolibacter pohnpeiensis]MBK1883619.1 serine protease [Luteolibacter pohnpeiensis]
MKRIAIQLSPLLATILPLMAQEPAKHQPEPDDLLKDVIFKQIHEKLDTAVKNGDLPDDVELNQQIREKIIAALQGIDMKGDAVDVKTFQITGTPEGVAKPIQYRLGFDIGNAPTSGPQAQLGISVSPVTPTLSHQLPIQPNTGLVVDAVSENSAAANAGITTGDVVAKLDDQILIHPDQLRVLIQNHKSGDEVKLTCYRAGKELELSATLTEQAAADMSMGWGPARAIQTLQLDPQNRAFIKLLDQQKEQMKALRQGIDISSSDHTEEQLMDLSKQVAALREALDKLTQAQKEN